MIHTSSPWSDNYCRTCVPVMRDGGIGSGQRLSNQLAWVRQVHQSRLQGLTAYGGLQGTAEHLLGQCLSTPCLFSCGWLEAIGSAITEERPKQGSCLDPRLHILVTFRVQSTGPVVEYGLHTSMVGTEYVHVVCARGCAAPRVAGGALWILLCMHVGIHVQELSDNLETSRRLCRSAAIYLSGSASRHTVGMNARRDRPGEISVRGCGCASR